MQQLLAVLTRLSKRCRAVRKAKLSQTVTECTAAGTKMEFESQPHLLFDGEIVSN